VSAVAEKAFEQRRESLALGVGAAVQDHENA
jgi:hypothetical protein